MTIEGPHRNRRPRLAALLVLAAIGLPGLLAAPPSMSQTAGAAPAIEIVEDDGGAWARLTAAIKDFQRRANAEIATHMNAIRRGDDLGALLLGLVIAFAYGVVHAFGPGHGKFIVVSYFLGREARVMRGVVMAVQVAIVHVIAAVIIVWLADTVLRAGFGIGLSEVPGVRAASFLIIVGIGVYMLYQAARTSRTSGSGGGDPVSSGGMPAASSAAGHGHSAIRTNEGRQEGTPASSGETPASGGAADHGHGHGHSHGNGHRHGHRFEGGLLALAAGMVPCPGAVLIMLYAVANDMIYPGFLLVAAMSLGIGSSICTLGVGAILARKTAMQVVARSGSSRRAAVLRNTLNYAGAAFVTLVGLVSFIAFLDVPLG